MLGQRDGDTRGLAVFGQRKAAQCAVAGQAGSVFGALAGTGMRIDPQYVQRQTQASAHRLAILLKICCGGLQTVVDMHRQYLPRPARCTGMQKCGGVRSAAVGNGQRQAGFKGCNRRVQRAGHGADKAYLPLALVSVKRP